MRDEALRERIKELQSLYDIASLTGRYDLAFEEILAAVVRLVPLAFQHPERTAARILLQGQAFTTENFRETGQRLACDITVAGKPVGWVEVCRIAPDPEAQDRQFLKKERRHLEMVAGRIALHAESRNDEETTEERLRESREIPQLLFDAVHDGITIADPLTRKFVQANRSFCEMTGYTQEEILGLDVAAFAPPAQKASFIAEIERCFAMNKRLLLELPMTRKDGSVFFAEISRTTFSVGGKHRSIAIFRDVTERKKILADLEQKTAEQEAILAGVDAGIALVKDRRFTWINRGMERMFGYRQHEVEGLPPELFYPTRESFEQLGREAYPRLAAGETYYSERPMKRRDGSLFLCSLSGRAVDSSNTAKGSIWIVMDLTGRSERETELALEQKRFRKLADLSIKDFKTFAEFLEEALIAAADMLASPYGLFFVYEEDQTRVQHIVFTPQVKENRRIAPASDEHCLDLAGCLSQVAQQRTPFFVNDFTAPHPLKRVFPEGLVGITRFLTVPILSAGRVVAVAALANKEADYSAADMRQLTFLVEALWEIGKRKRAESELRRSREEILELNRILEERIEERTAELMALSRRLMDVQEDERWHLARELHDEVGQALTGIKLCVENLVPGLPEEQRDTGCGIAASVGELLSLVRGLSLKLRPAILDDFGLHPALERHFESVAVKVGVRVALQCVGKPMRCARRIETALYRVGQEAVTNLVRHAGVREATARLTFDAAEIRLDVEDRGVGFVFESWNLQHDSMGISGMRERVTLEGGQFSLLTTPGQGTTITAIFPLPLTESTLGREHEA